MKDFKKYTDEDLSFFFSRGLSIHRRYRGEVKDVFKDIAISRPKAFKIIFENLETWRKADLIEMVSSDVANLIIKKYKRGE